MSNQHTLKSKKTLRVYFGSTILSFSILASSFVVGTLVILCVAFPFSVRYNVSKLWVIMILWIAKVACGIRYQIEGLENIKNIEAAIVLSKHQSAWETIAFRKILPMHSTLLKRSLLWIPPWGWALATLKPIAIDRKNQIGSLRMLIDKGTHYLKQGLWVVVFPEGTRVAPGEKKKFNAGGAILAQKSGFPVFPVAHNAGEFWPRYSFLKYPGTIRIKIGPLIETKGRKASEINAEAEAWIDQTMREISQREEP